MVGFIFGSKDKDKAWSYEELQRKRGIAETLAASNLRTPQNVGEGLASIGRALMYRKLDKRAGAEEARMREEFERKWGAVLGGSGGAAGGAYGAASGGGTPSGTWTPDAPAPKPTATFMGKPDVASGGLTFGLPKAGTGSANPAGGLDYGSAVMTPQEMLIAGAKARGLDPIDVATAISYETGGKFDPTIKGPTTHWGSHEGLIQFGDPQGQQHGAVFDQGPDAAWRSQLDPDSGAVWSYLDSTGVQPGMGLPEIYSAINAGAVGRMGASDANNGGAPGTVADKVASMGPHREKAAAFLGGTWTPAEGQPTASASGSGAPAAMGMDIGSLVPLASDPMASPAQKAIIETLIQQQLQAADPLRALEMERAQLELDALKNPTAKQPEALVERQALLSAAGVDPASPEGQQYLLTGELPEAPAPVKPYSDIGQINSDLAAGLITPEDAQAAKDALAKGSNNVTVDMGGDPALGKLSPDYTYLTNPDGTLKRDENGLPIAVPVPGSPAAVEAERNRAAEGRKGAAKSTEADVIINAAQRAREAAGNRDFGAFGSGIVAAILPQSDSAETIRQVNTLKANGTFSALQQMRDNSPTGAALGAASDRDLQLLADKAGALDPASPNFARDLDDYERTLLRTLYGPEEGDRVFAESRQGATPSAASAPTSSGAPVSITSDAEYDALPPGTVFVGPDGVTRRKP